MRNVRYLFLILGLIALNLGAVTGAQAQGVKGQIVYEATTESGARHIFVMSADGKNSRQLTQRGNNSLPVWSPNGQRIAFISDRVDGVWQLFMMDANPGQAIQLTKDKTNKSSPQWVPGGAGILFDATDADGFTQIYVVALETGEITKVSNSSFYNYKMLSISPDGKQFAFVSDNTPSGQPEIFTSDTSGDKRLTSLDSDSTEYPAWSPDGTQIAFDSSASGHAAIYVIDADGKNLKAIIQTDEDNWYPRWSPDGTKILYQVGKLPRTALYTADADGSNAAPVSEGNNGAFGHWTKHSYTSLSVPSGGSGTGAGGGANAGGGTAPTPGASTGGKPATTAGKGTLVIVNTLAITLHIVVTGPASIDVNMGPNTTMSWSLEAGTYSASASAQEHEDVTETITIQAGRTFQWTLRGG